MELPLRDETYLVSTSPVREAGAEALGAVAVLRDITALKRLETAKSMFVSMVAHEVKRPLAAIEGYLNLIVSGLAGHDPERDLNLLRRAQVRASTLRTLVSELMTLTAVETGKFALHRSATDFAEIIREAMAACQERADEKGLKLTFVTDDAAELTPVFADPGAILSAVTNLLDNAVKYTPERGHVNVRVFRDGVHMAVAIQDDGIGMTAEEKSKAFEEFYRASNRHTLNLPGTGLGLSLAKRLVDMHHGRIEVESAPDVGSTFTVYLPGLAASEPGTG